MTVKATLVERTLPTWNNGVSWKAYEKGTRVYVFPEGESIWENFLNRRNRPVDVFRDAAKRALADLGIEHYKLQWSRYAGCSCPCSPGFVLLDVAGHVRHLRTTGSEARYADVYVELT